MSTQSSAPAASKEYQQTNQWLQDMARKAGAGKALWPPKPSVGNAQEIVNAFLSYQKMTTGVLEQFMDSYLQFEPTGRVFHTEHAFTKAIMEDSASRAIPLANKNMVAFVSTSAHAVSSDAHFLRMTLDAMDAGVLGNPSAPDFTASVQTGHASHQRVGVSAQAGMGTSIFALLKASASASMETRQDNQTSRQVLATGKSGIDAKDRQVLTCLSAIYALEQSGVLPEGRFMGTFIRLSEIVAEKTGNEASDAKAAESLLTDPGRSIGTINEAMMQSAHIRNFLLPFCKDQLRAALAANPDASAPEASFWSETLFAVKNRRVPASTLKMLTRYADHQDQPEPNMVVAALRMWDILSQTRKSATEFLCNTPIYSGMGRPYLNGIPIPGNAIEAFAVSPAIGSDNALMVTRDVRGGLTPRVIPLSVAVDVFPELHPLLATGGLGDPIIANDQWDAALEMVERINGELLDATTHGLLSVLREDARNPGKMILARESEPSESLILDGLSPWD